ncbi:MAG: hypothetical protein HUU50_17080 [Candidatus Brocadiae bacterium]|nr:hypothetical protein [Candidatus Brocadiia bacterium]
MAQDRKWLQEIFQHAAKAECLTEVLKKQENKISRKELVKILSDPKHREKDVPGSVFDLVQQKIAMEREIEKGLRIAKKQGLNWMEAKYRLNIGPGEDYMRWKECYERF